MFGINVNWRHGSKMWFGFNYSVQDKKYGLMLPFWFPYITMNYVSPDCFIEGMAVVMPTIRIGFFKHGKYASWHFESETLLYLIKMLKEY